MSGRDNLHDEKVDNGNSKRRLKTKQKEENNDSVWAHFNHEYQENGYVEEETTKDHPLATPQVSETTPYKWAHQESNHVECALETHFGRGVAEQLRDFSDEVGSPVESVKEIGSSLAGVTAWSGSHSEVTPSGDLQMIVMSFLSGERRGCRWAGQWGWRQESKWVQQRADSKQSLRLRWWPGQCWERRIPWFDSSFLLIFTLNLRSQIKFLCQDLTFY